MQDIKPNYYMKNGVSCYEVQKIVISDLAGFDALAVGTIIKYLWRYKHKNGVEDLKKAYTYLGELIKNYDSKPAEYDNLPSTAKETYDKLAKVLGGGKSDV